MLDAIIIAGLRSWTHGEREKEREMGVFLEYLSSKALIFGICIQIYSKPLGDGRIFVYIVAIIGVS